MTLSATYPDKLAEIAEQLMRSPQHIRLAQENQVKVFLILLLCLIEQIGYNHWEIIEFSNHYYENSKQIFF